MKNSTFKFDAERNDTGKRVYLSTAYFVEVEPGIYQGFKDVMLEDPKTNKAEKAGRTVPWGKPLRVAENGDPIVAYTTDLTNTKICLTPIDSALKAGALASNNFEIYFK